MTGLIWFCAGIIIGALAAIGADEWAARHVEAAVGWPATS